MSGRGLALFDFDGTITTKDTLLEFIVFAKGSTSFYRGLAALSPVLFLFKTGMMPNWKAKELMLSYFFKGVSFDEFERQCFEFVQQVAPGLLRAGAMEKINQHRERGDRVVIVSASPENWVKKWAAQHGLECLATKLEVAEGRITGRFDGKNCHGTEKVERIRCHLDLNGYSEIHAYGDSSGDRPMLELATASYYKPFRR